MKTLWGPKDESATFELSGEAWYHATPTRWQKGSRQAKRKGKKQAGKQAEAVTHFLAQKGAGRILRMEERKAGKQMGGKNEKSCACAHAAVHRMHAQKKGSNSERTVKGVTIVKHSIGFLDDL